MNQVYLSGIAKEDVWIRKNEKNMLVASFVVEDDRGGMGIRCIAFGGLADKAGLTVKKGKFVELSGTLSFYSKLNEEGKKNYYYSVQVDYLNVVEGVGKE